MVVLKNSGGIKLQPYGMTLDYYPERRRGETDEKLPPPFVYCEYYSTFILDPSHTIPFMNPLKFL